jgi:hypothetical protein
MPDRSTSTPVNEVKKQQAAPVESITEKSKAIEPAIVKQEPKKSEPVQANPPANTEIVKQDKKQDLPANTIAATQTKITTPPIAPVISPTAAVHVNERKTTAAQEVSFVSDSLLLSLYDNGEIDGDTVSVLMNGELILAKQGLKASAIKKTIYLKPGDTEFTLVLYAENLGKYAPNTGLLVVYDGEERHQVRFSADLQQNAAIIFRKKR